MYTKDNMLDHILDPHRKNQSKISPRVAKSAAKTGQASNRVFEIQIFDQIPLDTGSRPLRVKFLLKNWIFPDEAENPPKFLVRK